MIGEQISDRKPSELVMIPDDITGVVTIKHGETETKYEFINGLLRSISYVNNRVPVV
jgi:hypothetical protein